MGQDITYVSTPCIMMVVASSNRVKTFYVSLLLRYISLLLEGRCIWNMGKLIYPMKWVKKGPKGRAMMCLANIVVVIVLVVVVQ